LIRRFTYALSFAAAVALFFATGAVRAQSKPINPNVPPPPPAANNSSSANGSTPQSKPSPNANQSQNPFPNGIDPTIPPPPPTEADEPANNELEKVGQPVYDPLAAQKSIEIGQFYFKQGNYDAAIDRFNDAVRLHPGYGKPLELLGNAYEKKHDYANAIKSYQQCLKVYPHDPDRKKIEEHIADLQKKQQEEAAQK
jgi:tetratricopeptide (TPR) repeat protein